MSVTRLTTAAGAWVPASLADMRSFARVSAPEDDIVLQRLMEAATAEVERYSGAVLVPGTFRVSVTDWAPQIELPLWPVVSVDAVRYFDTYGASTVLEAVDYYGDVAVTPARVTFGNSWSHPPWSLRRSSGIEIDITAGYATPQLVPADIVQQVITAALLLFEHRSDPSALGMVRRHIETQAMGYATVRV